MAFDRTNQAHLDQLLTEVTNDPIGMGYAAVINQTQPLLKLLNDPANNVGGEIAARTFDAEAMLDALDPADLGAQQTQGGADVYTEILLLAERHGIDIAKYKTKWRNEFASNSATVTALDAQTQALSRAEVLFGQGTEITREDWIAARDNGVVT